MSIEIPEIKERRPYDDDKPDGYLESDKDWILNNEKACIWFLENSEKILDELSMFRDLMNP